MVSSAIVMNAGVMKCVRSLRQECRGGFEFFIYRSGARRCAKAVGPEVGN